MGDVSIVQALLVFVVAFIIGIDQFSFLESLYQPIVMSNYRCDFRTVRVGVVNLVVLTS